MVVRRTYNHEVTSLIPGLARLWNDSQQVIRTHVLLLPSSIISYQHKLECKQVHHASNALAPYLWFHCTSLCLAEGYRHGDQHHHMGHVAQEGLYTFMCLSELC